jgi:hypothetical protein
MIDTAGRCTICQQQVPIGTMHTCSGIPAVTWPMAPLASATTDDILAEVQKLRTSLDTTLQNLTDRVRWLERRILGDPKDE